MQKLVVVVFLAIITFTACTAPSNSSEAGEETSETIDNSELEVSEVVEVVEIDDSKVMKEEVITEEVISKESSSEVAEKESVVATKSKKAKVEKVKVVEHEEPKEVVTSTKTKETTTTSKPKVTNSAKVDNEKPEPIVEPKETPTRKPVPALSHKVWDDLLRKHVSATGKVNYAGLKTDKGLLDGYVKILQLNSPTSSWSKNKTMAYWINVYNAYTVKLIVDNYPVASIRDLNGGNPWGVKNIEIAGKKYSLNMIEKDLLLKQYKEPRVHFAVNCAAKSCPALLNRAWTEDNIQANFEQQTRKFVNDSSFNKLSKKSLALSQIFEWYASDFGDVAAFITKYSDTEIKDNPKITYIPYDWTLNK